MMDLFIGALIFSIWCVTLFFGKEIGLSMFLFVFPFTYFLIDLLEKKKKTKNKKAKKLILPILLLSLTYVLFNNPFFNTLNLIVIPILLIIMVIELLNKKVKIDFAWFSEIIEIIFVPLSFIGETFEKVRQGIENKLKINLDGKKEKKVRKIVKAMLITLPIALVIMVLLISADEEFGNLFMRYFVRYIEHCRKN